MPRGTDLDAVTIRGSSNNFRMSDVVNMLEYPTKNGKAGWVTIRLFGPVYSDAFFWVKAKQGSNKSFRVSCRCYDPDTHQCVPEKHDPWYDEYRRECDENIDRKDRLLQYSRYFYMQAIVRKLQDNIPAKNRITAQEKKTGFKDPDSDSYTPVVVVQLTPKILSAIQDMKEDNVVKLKSGTRKAYNVTDEKFGRDIMIKKDMSPGVAPGDIYQVKLAVDSGRTPLTEEEKAYLTWDMNTIYAPEQSEAEVKRDFESWARRMGLTKREVENHAVDEDDDDTDDFEEERSTPKLKKKVSKEPEVEEDDFEEDDSNDNFENEEEDEAPKKKPAKKSKKVVEEEDEDDLDEDSEDDFDDEDEEEPAPKEKASKKKSVEDEDDFEDDDSDDDSDDDEDEEPAPKKKSSKKKIAEDEDDFDDEGEEEEPKPVKKSPKKKPVKKSKKVVEDDDDEFEDDDEDF